MLVFRTIVASCYLLSLTIAHQPFQGYETANFINIYFLGHPPYFEQFWNSHANLRTNQRTSRKSNFGDYLFGFHDTGFFGQNPYANHETGVAMYHHQPPHSAYHSPHPPSHYPPPTHHPPGHYPSHHNRPPTPPTPFRKPPFYHWPPHHQHYPHPTAPPSPNYNNYRPWQNQGMANGVDATNCNYPTPATHIYESATTTNQATPTAATNANTFQPNPSKQQQTAQVNTIVSGIFPGVSQTSIQTITTSATGTTISAPNNGLISGSIGQSNRPLVYIPPLQQTDQKNVNIVSQQRPPTTIQSTSVNNLISGVFPSLSQQGGNANIPTSTDRNVNDLVAGVFPSLNQQQNNQPQSTQVTSVNNLVSGVFPNLPQQGGNINPNAPTPSLNQQPNTGAQPTQITSSTPTDINNLIAGVFPSLTQPVQQNSGVTISSNTNTLISGVFKGFQGSGMQAAPPGLPSPTRQPTFPPQFNSIPVFQPDIQPVSNGQEQPTISTGTSTTTLIQPTAGTTITNGNGGGVTNADADDGPVYDIDIRLGPDGDELNTGAGISQRNPTVTS